MPKALVLIFGEVHHVVDLMLGNNKRVPFGHGRYVKKCIVVLVLGDLVAGNLSSDYLAKN